MERDGKDLKNALRDLSGNGKTQTLGLNSNKQALRITTH